MNHDTTGSSPPEPNALADLLAPFWSAERTARALGLSCAGLAAERAAGDVLGLKAADTDTYFYPIDQFEKHDGHVRVKPALRAFFAILRDRDPWTVGVLLHTSAPELDGHTPLAWVRARRPTRALLEYAEIVDAEFRR